MSLWTILKSIGTFGGKTTWGFFTKFRIGIMFIVFTIIFTQSIILSAQQKSINPLIEDIGGRFFLVTNDLNNKSLEIIESRGIKIDRDLGFFKSFYKYISTYWSFIESLFLIYFWLTILELIILYLFIFDTSKTPTAWLFAIMFFFLGQMIFIVMYLGKDAYLIPFTAFINMFVAFAYLFTPLGEKVSSYVKKYPINSS